jgi:copper transport protein
MSRALVVVVLVAAGVFATAAPGWAHARLVSSDPPGGATLAHPPQEIVLQFSEPIEAAFGGVQLFDPAGDRVETADARIDGPQVRLPVRELADPGIYTVAFRILSGDGHPVESRFTFIVAATTPTASETPTEPTPTEPTATDAAPTNTAPENQPSPPAASPPDVRLEEAGRGTDVGMWVGRLANYLALTAVVGLLLAAGYLLAAGRAFDRVRRRAVRLGAAAAAVWAATGVALFVYGLSSAAARPLPQALSADLVVRFAGTRFGATVLAQAGLAVVVAVVAAVARSRRLALVALGLAAVGALAPAWWGHAGTSPAPGVAVASDWAHVLAATAWVGGLGALAGVVLSRAAEPATPAGRFSRLAGWALVVVGATGVINALVRISSMDELVGTTWGQLVIVKALLFAGIALLGWRNRTRLLPRLRADEAGGRRAFRTLALAEVGLMLLAFGTATTMASGVPADAEAAARIQSVVTAFGDGQINVTIDPAQVGDNLVHLYFLDDTGRQREVGGPSLSLRRPGTTVDARLLTAGPGHYTVLALPIPRAGDYELRVTALVDGVPETATGTVAIR